MIVSAGPDNATVLHSGRGYCWAATPSEDRSVLIIDLWVFDAPCARGQWTTVAGAGFSLDRDNAQSFLPFLQRFLASAPEKP